MEQETNKNQEGTWKDEDWVLDMSFRCGTPSLQAAFRRAGYDTHPNKPRKGSPTDSKDSKDKQEP